MTDPLRFFEHVLHAAGVSIIATSPDGVITFFNRTAEEWLGWSASEVVGLRTPEIFHEPTEVAARAEVLTRELGRPVPAGFETFVAKARLTRAADTNEWTYIRRDGSRVAVLLTVTPLFEGDDAPFGYLGVAHDITTRKEAERALREREATLQSLFDSAPIAIGVMAPNRTFRKINRFLERLVGRREEELLGQTPRICYDSDEEYQAVGRALYAALQSGTGTSLAEFRLRHADGSARDVMGSLAYLDPERPEAGLVSTLLDVTDLKRVQREHVRLEEQLRQAQKLESVGRLAGGIAHDLNNMLMPIMGYAQQLREDLPHGTAYEMAGHVLTAAERSRDLLRQLLTFARKQPVKLEPVDLGDVLRDFARVLHHTLPETIRIEVEIEAQLPRVRADAVQIEQVILNLAINAADAMPSGGALTLRVSAHRGEPPEVVLTVEDTGCGMTREVRDQAFEPFFTTKDSGKGTGLGLAMVYGIVQQHGGRIALESEIDKGTRFRIHLPAERSPSVERAAQAGDDNALLVGTETILLVEDQEPVLTLVKRLLLRLGYRVLGASNAAQGISLAAAFEGEIHLLVSDVLLPGLNGKELYDRLRGSRPDLRVLYMSGYTADVLPEDGREGAVLLAKPFTIPVLARAIRSALDAPAR